MGTTPSKALRAPSLAASREPGCSCPWSDDLPLDVAGLLLRRLPSLADRVRFGAVCRRWRRASRQQSPTLPPALPWLPEGVFNCNLDGNFNLVAISNFKSLPDGELHALPRLENRARFRNYAPRLCCSDGWLLYLKSADADGCSIRGSKRRRFLVNPLSGAILKLPSCVTCWLDRHGPGDCVQKLIVYSNDLVVAMVADCYQYARPSIACCRPGARSWSKLSSPDDFLFCMDIVAHNGKFYAVDSSDHLYEHEVSSNRKKPMLSPGKEVISGRHIWLTPGQAKKRFLVVSSAGKLLMLRWSVLDEDTKREGFEVFEADWGRSRWSQVDNLGDDQAIFVSENCSRALPASSTADGYLKGNHIYFVDNFAGGCRTYDLGNNTCDSISIPSIDTGVGDISSGAWFFPRM